MLGQWCNGIAPITNTRCGVHCGLRDYGGSNGVELQVILVLIRMVLRMDDGRVGVRVFSVDSDHGMCCLV